MPSRSTRAFTGVPPELQSRLEAAGLRRTLATRAVLGLFIARRGSSLTHAQALAALTARGLDLNRVTLYRLLDRLAACGVLQRHADEQRTWRFRLAEHGGSKVEEGAVLHFECGSCHRQFAVPEASASTRAAARDAFQALAGLGHQGLRVDISIQGTCSNCMAAKGMQGAAT